MDLHTDKLSDSLAALIALANLGDSDSAISRFLKVYQDYLESEKRCLGWTEKDVREWILGLRDDVRELWRGGPRANQIAWSYLLNVEVFQDDRNERIVCSPEAVGVDWARGKLVLDCKYLDPFQKSIYELMQVSRLAKVCAREGQGCSAPFFIAKDSRTRYCSTDCADAMQGEWRKEWWSTKGKAWRKKRAKQSKQSKRKGK